MRMLKRFWLAVAVLLIATASSLASPLDDAAKAYDDGDFAKAISIYNQVAEETGVSASLLYNLGNSYVKVGDYGKAMLSYQRALRLDPSDKNIKENISFITSKVGDNNKAEAKGKKISVVAEDKPFFARVRHYISFSHLSNTWALWAGIMFVITCGCAALYIFASNVAARKIGFFGGFAALCLSCLSLIFALVSASDRGKSDEGVVTAYKVNLFSQPDSTAKTGANALTRGTLLNVIDTDEDPDTKKVWYKVRLNSDYTGWIQSDDFELI